MPRFKKKITYVIFSKINISQKLIMLVCLNLLWNKTFEKFHIRSFLDNVFKHVVYINVNLV